MSEPVCRFCKHVVNPWGYSPHLWACGQPDLSPYDPVTGKRSHRLCSAINKGDCKYFEQKSWLGFWKEIRKWIGLNV